MRTEEMMMKLFTETAINDDRIRVMTLEGSRVNNNVPKDEYQDYDVTYIVKELNSFLESDAWLDAFGEIVMMQKPEAMHLFPAEMDGFSYLMYFEDGVKVDLSLFPVEQLEDYLASDPLIKVILDKDGRIPHPKAPTDEPFHIQKPAEEEYLDSCNEFWHVVPYVAKGLLRNEILFANHHQTAILHKELLRMMAWKVGFETGYSLSVGKQYKYLDRYVSEDWWGRLLETFHLSSYEEAWNSLEKTMELFREVSATVGQQLGYAYPLYDKSITEYIQRMGSGNRIMDSM